MINPYEPPAIDDSPAPPGAKLFSPGQAAWATFLGGPLAGTVLLALNYWRLEKVLAGRLSLVGGALATLLLLVLAFVLPDSVPPLAIPAISTVAMYQVMKSLQGEALAQLRMRRGKIASIWAATGVGLLCLVLLLALLFAVFLALPEQWIDE